MRKIIKSSNTEEVNTFRLHYFPSIPSPAAGDAKGMATGGATAADPVPGRTGLPNRPPASSPRDDKERLQDVERQAHEAGFARGRQEGREAAQQQAAPLVTALETTLSELDGLRERMRRHLEQEVVELALHVARKVVRHELSVSKETILCVVQEAMGRLEDPGRIAIRLNPEDLEHIRGAGERLAAVVDDLDSIHFEEDPGIACGGCYIQTDYGEIDARIQEQLRVVEEAFRTELGSPATDG